MRRAPSFLLKTLDILSDRSLTETIAWDAEGLSFIIKDVEAFTKEVLPKYFRHNNFSSYVRQLNMYGFHKCRHRTNEIVYSHPQFSRGSFPLSELKRDASAKLKANRCTLMYFKLRAETKQLRRDSASLAAQNSAILAEIKETKSRGQDLQLALCTIERSVRRRQTESEMQKNRRLDYSEAYDGLIEVDEFLA
jgi:hypothetical protein